MRRTLFILANAVVIGLAVTTGRAWRLTSHD
jgi:hypothetical protein